MTKGMKRPKAPTESFTDHLSVLRKLSEHEARHYHIQEICRLTGYEDEREMQRCLFILEGQKLVTPYPEGDFTSRTWQITKYGLLAIKTFKEAAS